jgi:hypothetical protein
VLAQLVRSRRLQPRAPRAALKRRERSGNAPNNPRFVEPVLVSCPNRQPVVTPRYHCGTQMFPSIPVRDHQGTGIQGAAYWWQGTRVRAPVLNCKVPAEARVNASICDRFGAHSHCEAHPDQFASSRPTRWLAAPPVSPNPRSSSPPLRLPKTKLNSRDKPKPRPQPRHHTHSGARADL